MSNLEKRLLRIAANSLASAPKRAPESFDDLPGFVEFCERILRVRLTPGQRVIAKVAYDGVNPCDLTGDERARARRIFGAVETVRPEARHVVTIVAGARGGKSYVLSALRLLHLALTVPLATLAPGEHAVGICVAPTLKLAQQTLGYIRGAVDSNTALSALVVSDSVESLVLRRHDGSLVALQSIAASTRGAALRGRSLVGVAMDEAALFRDPETGAVNDEEVFRAVGPRVVQGGQIIMASTPWAEAGLLHALHKANHGAPVTALAAHAPTLELRDDEHTRSYVAREEQRDPINAKREFGAEFMGADGATFFDARAIAKAIDPTLKQPAPWAKFALVSVGADFGFNRDSSALVVVQRVEDTYTVSLVDEMVPAEAPLQPSRVVSEFAKHAKEYGGDTVVADGHYRESVREHLIDEKLYLVHAPEGQIGKAETYTAARNLLHEGRVRLPNHERLLRQLREVMMKPTPGGALSIQSPRWKAGGHGDLVSALVLALWQAWRLRYQAPQPEKTYADERLESKLRRMNEERAPWWRGEM